MKYKYIINSLVFILIVIVLGCEKQQSFDLDSNYKITETGFTTMGFHMDKEWESKSLGYINVIREDSIWRLWYESFYMLPDKFPDFSGVLCYAYSKDGINWIKPELGIYKFNGNQSNIIYKPQKSGEGIHGVGILKTDDIPYKYKMVYSKLTGLNKENPTRIYLMESSDGINWKNERMILNHPSDTQNILLKVKGKYYLFFRRWSGGAHGVGKRTIAMVKSDKLNFFINNLVVVKIKNKEVPDVGEYYNSSAKVFNDRLLMFPTVYDPDQNLSKIDIAEGDVNVNLRLVSDVNMSYKTFSKIFCVVAPQIIPVEGMKDQFYLFIMSRSGKHNLYENKDNYLGEITRIKVKITTN